MSISPQSLARTRDKRSLRIPARFDDFSEIPHEVRTFRNVGETRGKTPKRHAASVEHDQSNSSKKLASESSTIIQPGTASTSAAAAASSSSAKRPPPRLRTTTPAENETNTSRAGQQITPTDSPLSSSSSPIPLTPVSVARQAAEIELECKESSFEIHKVPKSQRTSQGITKRSSLSKEARKDLKEVRKRAEEKQLAAENLCEHVQSPSPSENSDSPVKIPASTSKNSTATTSSRTATTTPIIATTTLKRVEENFHVQKSPFHPSITISNGVRLSCPLQSKPLYEKKSTPEATAKSCGGTQTSAIPKSTSRKKSRGFSLMAKPPNVNGNPQAKNVSHQTTYSNHRMPPTKYFNNLTQNQMQYGTRLMLNEPIYLPRSVATIAPITTTYEQIVAQSRKPPFISKKAEAYIAYQDERKCNYLTSNYTALVKVTKYLNARDLLNLRLVNKSWKSIVDSDAVWQRVTLNSETRIRSWIEFACRVLCKFQSSELVMEEFLHANKEDEDDDEVADKFELTFVDALSYSELKRIWIKTVNESENRIALELLCALNATDRLKRDIEIVWKVKVEVNERGIALVPLIRRNQMPVSSKQAEPFNSKRVYCYQVHPNWLACNSNDNINLVELTDLEDFFNGNKNDTCAKMGTPHKPLITITPI